MKSINAYLVFDGNCREAMEFYHRCLGGELSTVPFEAMMPDVPEGSKGRLMHANLTSDAFVLMASDDMPGNPLRKGNNFSLNIDCESVEEVERLFTALGAGGTVTMPPQDAMWGSRFAMLRDRFDVGWMFNYPYARPGMPASQETAAAR